LIDLAIAKPGKPSPSDPSSQSYKNRFWIIAGINLFNVLYIEDPLVGEKGSSETDREKKKLGPIAEILLSPKTAGCY
jgi:hypothetical protein